MRAAAYARYSTDKQTENSIAYQMEAITKYCLDHQIDLCAAFSDEAASGHLVLMPIVKAFRPLWRPQSVMNLTR